MNPLVGINLPNTSYDPGVTRKYLSTFVEQGFDVAGRARQQQALRVQVHGISSRVTTCPRCRWDSTISSMSCAST